MMCIYQSNLKFIIIRCVACCACCMIGFIWPGHFCARCAGQRFGPVVVFPCLASLFCGGGLVREVVCSCKISELQLCISKMAGSVFAKFQFWFVHAIYEGHGCVVKMAPGHRVGAMHGCQRTYLIPRGPAGFKEIAKRPRGPEPLRSRFNSFSQPWVFALFGCVSHLLFSFLCVFLLRGNKIAERKCWDIRFFIYYSFCRWFRYVLVLVMHLCPGVLKSGWLVSCFWGDSFFGLSL